MKLKACIAVLLLWVAGAACATEKVLTDYMLNYMGCHLEDGRGYAPRGVPVLTGYMGNFLKVPGGRAFLVQVPGAAQSDLSDAELAALLNWMLHSFSPAQIPADFVGYSAIEVGQLRHHPLVDVAGTRAALVRLIDQKK